MTKNLSYLALLAIGCGSAERLSVFEDTADVFYRIPSLLQLSNGAVYAFAEERIEGREDWRNTNLVFRQVFPTMGPIHSLPTEGGYIYSDPQPVELPSGDVLVLFNRRDTRTGNTEQCERKANNHILAFRIKHFEQYPFGSIELEDHTKAWENSVSSNLLPKASPTQAGMHNGILHAVGYGLGADPSCHSHKQDRSFVMQSFDEGKHWQLHYLAHKGTNEASFVPGLLVARAYNNSTTRILDVFESSVDALENFEIALCHGGIVEAWDDVLLSFPNSHMRENLVLYSWNQGRIMQTIERGRAGYSNLIRMGNAIGVVYEVPEEGIVFKILQKGDNNVY